MSQGPFQELPKIIFSQMPSVQWDVALMEMVTGSSCSRGGQQAGRSASPGFWAEHGHTTR